MRLHGEEMRASPGVGGVFFHSVRSLFREHRLLTRQVNQPHRRGNIGFVITSAGPRFQSFTSVSPCPPAPPAPSFAHSDGVMERWVSLEVPTAYGLSLHDGTLVVACADGLVRLFRAADLRYVATLPRPAPLGRANISSIRELQEITDSSKVVQGVAFQVDGGTETDDRAESVPSLVVRYPAALGCRMSPSGNRVACVYADRGLFIWDVTDPLCIGKYRSFLAHSACVWDIQRIPREIGVTNGRRVYVERICENISVSRSYVLLVSRLYIYAFVLFLSSLFLACSRFEPIPSIEIACNGWGGGGGVPPAVLKVYRQKAERDSTKALP